MLLSALLPIDIRMFECAYPQLFTLVCWSRDCETGLHVDYELHASRCRRSLCEIPSRTANGGRLTERARLKEPIKWQGRGNIKGRLSEAGLCDLTPRTASPERIGESSRSSGSDCAAPGGIWQSGRADVCHYPLGMECARTRALT